MMRLVIRRAEAGAAPLDDVAATVESLGGKFLDRSGRTMLVDMPDSAAIDKLRSLLQGWVVSAQGSRIEVPDTRLKTDP